MLVPVLSTRIQRVRGIILTDDNALLFIKRIKPNKPAPYWVAPGGGVEPEDDDLETALRRELYEELGARVDVLDYGFGLRHTKAGKRLDEHFFICRLVDYDLRRRHGPEFEDPSRGQYLPDVVPLSRAALLRINIKTPELRDWLLQHLDTLAAL